MELRKCDYEIEISGERIKFFEERVLESGICNFTVPMWFSRKDDKIKITYECSGYSALRDLTLKKPKEVLEILEKTILTLNRSIEFFIPPENITLNMDTVFFHLAKRNIKIAYMPDEERNLYSKIVDFLSEIQECASEESKEYIENIKEEWELKNKNLRDLASFISDIRRDLYMQTMIKESVN